MDTNSSFQAMWDTRPPRIPKEQGGNPLVGGICEGIGARYNVDVTFVRVVFAVLALIIGGGIFLYLLCWFTMPRFGTQTSPAQAIFTPEERLSPVVLRDRSTGWLLLIGLLIFFPSVTLGTDPRAVLAPLAGIFTGFVAWWLLHQRTPTPPPSLGVHYK